MMSDRRFGVTFSHDEALVFSEWLYQLMGTERFDVLVNEDPAVWVALHNLAGALETSLPDIFAADYGDRLDRARWRLGTPATLAATHRRRASATPGSAAGATLVTGWIHEDDTTQLMRFLAAYIGYAYDALDEQALVGALDDTDDASGDGWFEYPLHGAPVLTVGLARSPGTDLVAVRVQGHIDDVLAARIDTLLDVLPRREPAATGIRRRPDLS
jgi:hypothetical protein